LEDVYRILWVLGGSAAGESDAEDTARPEAGGQP
jgi:hypothetical protein